jgi:peptidoglycan/LPS O-acetylase OafA/YrhL
VNPETATVTDQKKEIVRGARGRGTTEMPNLDLLRSIAVSLVVVEHTLLAMRIGWIDGWQIAWIGVVGVFMFFVHTSLVLMWSLERNPSVLGFYIRRFFRIYPLAMAAILITVLFHIPTMHTAAGDTFFAMPSWQAVVANLLLIQNLHGGGVEILGVMWTLPLEVQMYVLLPFLFFFLRQNLEVWPLLLLLGATAFYAEATFPADNNTFVVCIPYFLSGVLSYVLFKKVRPRLPGFLMPCLIALLLFGFMLHPSWRLGWALTLILGVALPFFRQIRAKWLIRAGHEVAKYSYGIYLAHSFCIVIGVNKLQGYNLAIRLAAILLPLALIVVVFYHLLEKPLMDFGARWARKLEKREELAAAVSA